MKLISTVAIVAIMTLAAYGAFSNKFQAYGNAAVVVPAHQHFGN